MILSAGASPMARRKRWWKSRCWRIGTEPLAVLICMRVQWIRAIAAVVNSSYVALDEEKSEKGSKLF